MADGLGLGDVYDETIERIKAQGGDKSRLGIGALMWISHAEQPLGGGELCHALGIELGSRDFNADNIPSIKALIGCCQGLITVDKETSTVRLVHFTLKEYLSAHLDIFSSPHSTIAEICLTYLNSQQVKALSPSASGGPYYLEPFLRYCSLYWGVHAKRELSDYGRSLVLELLQEYDDHISAVCLTWDIECLGIEVESCSLLLSGLHCASLFGLVEVAAALIEIQGYGTSERYCFGDSPLAWAARNGHGEVVKMLLGREEVDPDESNNYGQTPLFYAAAEGNDEVVKILLGREGVNPDRPDNGGRTPLSYAANRGRDEAVEILLEREEVNPDCPDNDGRTPLSYAAAGGSRWDTEKYAGVVKILLEQAGVNPEKTDNGGRTPLSYAASRGRLEAVEMLLGREEVNPDCPDNDGRTPLSYAATGGYLWDAGKYAGVVKMLLERAEVIPERRDNWGRTPLLHATSEGHEEVVQILLERCLGDLANGF